MDTFGPYLIFFIPTSFIVCVIFLVIAIFQDAKTVGKMESIKSAFLSIMSFLSLLVVSGSLIFLSFVSLRMWVFTDAYSNYPYWNQPPILYYSMEKPDAVTPQCTDNIGSCPLNEANKRDVTAWAENYQQWKKGSAQDLQNNRDSINGASVLIVSLPLFIVFFWAAHQEKKKRKEKSALEPVYSYAITFIGISLIVIAGAVLINAGLKSSFIPKEAENQNRFITPFQIAEDSKNAENLPLCIEKCEFPEEYATLATEWKQDYNAFQQEEKDRDPYAGKYASGLPMIIFGVLLTAFHFPRKQKEKKKQKRGR